jgi:putative transposase
MKQWYEARKLAGLPRMPARAGDVPRFMKRHHIERRVRQLQGGGWVFSGDDIFREFPELRIAIYDRVIEPAPALPAPDSDQERGRAVQTTGRTAPPAVAVEHLTDTKRVEDLTEKDRACGVARVNVLNMFYQSKAGVGSEKKTIGYFVQLARAGSLPKDLQELVPVANARRGKGSRTLSHGTLKNWIKLDDPSASVGERIAFLAPRSPGKDYTVEEDVLAVLTLYRKPNKPSLASCAREVGAEHGDNNRQIKSLLKRASRYMKKLPRPLFDVGRNTGAALKALQLFRRRKSPDKPNIIWVGDGHSAKFKVAHPNTGSAFTPEITVIMDAADRYVVGCSVSLSENRLAVADALRHGMTNHGVPLIYYSDGGAGQTNKMFDAPITGTLGAVGTHHETGLPGNAQGHGLVERVHQTVFIPLAKRFPTYQGKGADRETLRKVSREIDRDLKAAESGEVVVLPRKLPTWQQFIAELDDAIEQYNTTHHHSALPKLDGVNHATPAKYRAHLLAKPGVQIDRPNPAELAALFMPSEIRRAARGEVKLWNGIYFHRDLMLVDGQDVKVHYDIHDEKTVRVCKLTGELIAVAVLDGNRSDYFPKPLIRRLEEDRSKRRMARLQDKMNEVQAELAGTTQLNDFRLRNAEQEPPISQEEMDAAFRTLMPIAQIGGKRER